MLHIHKNIDRSYFKCAEIIIYSQWYKKMQLAYVSLDKRVFTAIIETGDILGGDMGKSQFPEALKLHWTKKVKSNLKKKISKMLKKKFQFLNKL